MEEIDIYDLKKIKLDKEPRAEQIELLNFISKSVLNNTKFIITDAPVGIGKSYMAVMFMDWFRKNYSPYATFDILTNSKILQEQYTNDFDFMHSLWGKGSYECEQYNTDCGTGGEWCKIQGKTCENCPYQIAKYKFENGDVALTNYHLFLTYMVYMPQAFKRSSKVLIIDEAHGFDEVFSDFITTKINKQLLKRNGFTDIEIEQCLNFFGENPEDLTPQEFINIINDDFLPISKTVINRLAREGEKGSIQALNYLQSLNNNFLKWERLKEEYDALPDNWIVEIEKVYKRDKNTNRVTDVYYDFTAQPVWAYPYLEKTVWSRYDFVLFMSGTILDKQMFAQMNGFDPNNSSYISMDSPFPISNRPIYYFHNAGKQSFKTKEITWDKQKPILKKILKKHSKTKGIIHTSNYEIQGWVENFILEDRILSHTSENRNEVLQHHYNSTEPTVLVSPSMITGVDLKGDLSRHQTILKIPYPNLGSKKIKRKMETNKNWYGWKTVCDLIQACGRSVRSHDDKANTYIIDSCFGDVIKYNSHYFPKWFLDSIIYVD